MQLLNMKLKLEPDAVAFCGRSFLLLVHDTHTQGQFEEPLVKYATLGGPIENN